MIENLLLSFWVPILLGVVLVGEAMLFAWLWHRAKKGIPLNNVLPFLFSGIFFALALYAMVMPQQPWLLSIALLGAFFSHIIDIKQRWRNK